MTGDSITYNTGEEDVQEMKELQRPTSYSSSDSKSKLSKSRPDVLPGDVFSFSETPAEAPLFNIFTLIRMMRLKMSALLSLVNQ